MDIQNAYELNLKLSYLTLVGQDEEGNLEWVGRKEDWNRVESACRKEELPVIEY